MAESKNLLTSTPIWKVLRAVSSAKTAPAIAIETGIKEESLTVYTSLLKKNSLIIKTADADKRKKFYEINKDGLASYFVKWLAEYNYFPVPEEIDDVKKFRNSLKESMAGQFPALSKYISSRFETINLPHVRNLQTFFEVVLSSIYGFDDNDKQGRKEIKKLLGINN